MKRVLSNLVVKSLLLLRRSLFQCVLLSFLSSLCYAAEEWVARYNGPGNGRDRATAIAVDDSGNIYVTGCSWGSGTDYDYATIKYNPAGDTVWVRRYNGPGNGADCATAIAVDGDGNVYVTGESGGSGTGADYATIKYNSAGDTVWVRRYNGPGNCCDKAKAIAVDGNGNVYVTGVSGGSGTDEDYATIKYNPAGDTVWVRRYNGPGNGDDWAEAIAVDGEGNVYVTGTIHVSGTDYDYATIKYNSAGDTVWVRRYNGPESIADYATAIAVDGTGNVYVTGQSGSSGTYPDYVTIKYNSAGDTVWVRGYNGPGNGYDEVRAIAVDDSGNVYVTGWCDVSWCDFSFDYGTIKYDSAGDIVWVRRYSGPVIGDDYAEAIAVDDSGNVYVTGGSPGSGTYYDYATIKYNSGGDIVWVARYNGPGNEYDFARAIAVDGGYVYVTGGSDGSGTDEDYATIKYSVAGVEEDVRIRVPESNSLKVYPNPVLGGARIRYEVASKGVVSLGVYDISGRLVRTIYSGEREKGCYEVSLCESKEALSPGIYFIKFEVGEYKETKKIVLVHTDPHG